MLQFPLVLMNRLNEQPSLLFLFVCSLHLHRYSGDIFHILGLYRAARVVGNVPDCRSEFDPGTVHKFVEIDNETMSMAMFLHSADSRRIVFSYK